MALTQLGGGGYSQARYSDFSGREPFTPVVSLEFTVGGVWRRKEQPAHDWRPPVDTVAADPVALDVFDRRR